MSESSTNSVAIPCPQCSATHIVWDEVNASGTPTFQCRACGRRFVAVPKKDPAVALLATQIVESDDAPEGPEVVPGAFGECPCLAAHDARTSLTRGEPEPFDVSGEPRSRWAVPAERSPTTVAGTRRVLVMVLGDRSAATAKRLWGALPRGYRTGVAAYTDVLASYRGVIPRARHRAVGKDTGLTAHIERFWLTLRQRCARFVRKTLTFSKCSRNYLGALWYFIRLYNASRP